MTQKLTLAALLFSAATAAGATCNGSVSGCGNLSDPRQTTAGGDARATAAGGNQHQTQDQTLNNRNTAEASTGAITNNNGGATFAPTTIIKHGDIPVPAAYAAPLLAAPAPGCQISEGGVSVGVQVPGAGASVSWNRGTSFGNQSKECDDRGVTHRMIGSGNVALECVGVLTAAQRDPALKAALEVAEGKGQLNGSFCQALAGPQTPPVTVIIVDKTPASTQTCSTGSTPVKTANGTECRRGGYALR